MKHDQPGHSLVYLRFLSLVKAIREIPTFPQMDSVEERMLNLFAASWHHGEPLPVLRAMSLLPDVSATTAYRRIKSLRSKGMISLETDEDDNRVKYVNPTDLAVKYFSALGECLEKAQAR